MSEHPAMVAVVTGAAGPVGAAIAQALAADGTAVAVVDLPDRSCVRTLDTILTAGGQAMAFPADVRFSHQVEAVIARITAELGAPLTLVNNADVTRNRPLMDMSEDDWDVVHGTHVRGAFLMSRAASRFMAAAGWGRIVNISNACPGPAARRANHMAAAAGLHGLTRGLAAEIGQFGVTVNSVVVGPPAELAPDEVAKVVAFLVSEQAADLTGRVLSGR